MTGHPSAPHTPVGRLAAALSWVGGVRRAVTAALAVALLGAGLAVAGPAAPAHAKYGVMHHPASGRVIEKIHRSCEGTANSHPGIDIANGFGAPVFAAYRGRVIDVHRNRQNGLVVRIRHDAGYVTRYARLSSIRVGEGQWVSRGQPIGAMGDRGHLNGRSFLHFEVRRYGEVYRDLNQGYRCGAWVTARYPIQADFPGLT